MRFTIEHALLRCNHASGESGQEAEERTSRVCAQLSRREEERRAHTHRVDIATEQGRFFDWLPNPVKPTAERQLCGCLDHSFSEALRGRSTVLQQRMPRILHRTCFVTIFLAKGKYIRVPSTRFTHFQDSTWKVFFFHRMIPVIWISCCGWCKRKRNVWNDFSVWSVFYTEERSWKNVETFDIFKRG